MTESEKEELATSLKEQSQSTFDIIANAEKNGYLSPISPEAWRDYAERQQQNLEQILAQRTAERNNYYLHQRERLGKEFSSPKPDAYFAVGNWDKWMNKVYVIRTSADNPTLSAKEKQENKLELAEITKRAAHLNSSQIGEPTDWKLKQEDIVHQSSGTYIPLFYSPQNGKICINDKVLSHRQDDDYRPVAEAAKGNPAALNCLIYHELNHKHNYDHDGLGQLSWTPTNAAKGDILTEKLSLCTEYLHMVEEYNTYKAEGKKTIEYNGEQHSIDSLLEVYPGLKEAVDKHGTDLNNPETKKAIVQAAMTYWQQDREKAYTRPTGQTRTLINEGYHNFENCSFSKQLELLQQEEDTYNKVATAMMSDINIGNQQISLTDCRDIIDTFSTEDAQKMIKEECITLPSLQEYQEINTYLESIGKTSDEEKMKHISQTIKTASSSLDSYDRDLENIILSYNPIIRNENAVIEKNGNTVIAIDGDKKYDITEFALKNSQQQENTIETPRLKFLSQNTH